MLDLPTSIVHPETSIEVHETISEPAYTQGDIVTLSSHKAGMTRRSFVGLAAATSISVLLSSCSTSGEGASAQKIKFWDMPMGNERFNALDKQIVSEYKPAAGLADVTYQVIQWNNFPAVFASAVASGTGPAVSSGGGTTVFEYVSKGKIAYADHLIESWKKNGIYDDILPGLLDQLKTKDGHQAAVPQNLSAIVMYYSPSLLEKANVAPPKDWQTYLEAAAALKKIGVYGLGTGAGAGNFQGGQTIVSWMIMNGGGLFNEDQQPDCVTDRNIEAVDFLIEMVRKGYSDPGAPTYTTTNVSAQWKAQKFGLGFDVPTLPDNVGAGWDGVIGSPMVGPHGDKGTLCFINNIMLWNDSPSQKSGEAFLTYYFQNMAPLWTKGTMTALPPLKSIINTKEFQADKNLMAVVNEWQPVMKTWAAPGKAMGANTPLVDGTSPMADFAQNVLGGKVTAKEALVTLQSALMSSVKS